jgi:hypothetical protein
VFCYKGNKQAPHTLRRGITHSVHQACADILCCITAKPLYGERSWAFNSSDHSTFWELVVGTGPNLNLTSAFHLKILRYAGHTFLCYILIPLLISTCLSVLPLCHEIQHVHHAILTAAGIFLLARCV